MNDGILLINKKAGWTSNDVCKKIKHILKTKKVGHTGTLDPFADGLMVLTINRGTKCGQFIECLDKIYIAKLKLGETTDTLDTEGKVISTAPIPEDLDANKIKEVLKSFLGKSSQIPPMYSAIKVAGKPLYEYAREGKEIKTKPREIEIYDLILMNYEAPYVMFLAHVSKGTYIRTLASDIAVKLGTVGHLVNLTRTQVGRYFLKDSKDIETVTCDDIISIKDALAFMPKVKVDNATVEKVKNGLQLPFDSTEKQVLVVDFNDNPIAVYENIENKMYQCVRGLF